MTQIALNVLHNAALYINGNSCLGRADEIKLPTIKVKLDEIKATGMIGTIKVPVGVEALDGDIKWNAVYPEQWPSLLDPFSALQLQIRGSLETHGSTGRTAQRPYVVLLTASFYEVPMGDFKPKSPAEFPSKFNATYIKQKVDGQDVLEFDAMANIWRVGGKDMLETYRQNLGG